jgi:hypothetical protein
MVSFTLRPLYLRKAPSIPTEQEVCWAIRAGLDAVAKRIIPVSAGNLTPAVKSVIIPTETPRFLVNKIFINKLSIIMG